MERRRGSSAKPSPRTSSISSKPSQVKPIEQRAEVEIMVIPAIGLEDPPAADQLALGAGGGVVLRNSHIESVCSPEPT
jgi:hypothetical protein